MSNFYLILFIFSASFQVCLFDNYTFEVNLRLSYCVAWRIKTKPLDCSHRPNQSQYARSTEVWVQIGFVFVRSHKKEVVSIFIIRKYIVLNKTACQQSDLVWNFDQTPMSTSCARWIPMRLLVCESECVHH